MEDLHDLPRFDDALGYLYVERTRIDQHEQSVACHDARGCVPIPAASLSVLMLGPGTTITHAAIKALADNNCLLVCVGEQGVRFYAHGMGGTRNSSGLLRQARLATNPELCLRVVLRMYRMRFGDKLSPDLTLKQIRGKEGVRVRAAYARESRRTGVPWQGRSYKRSNWASADPVNRALSAANACLYGLVHAAILAAGYSPALGFIHTGKQLSFVYDVADLYKVDLTVPIAFEIAAEGGSEIERRVRLRCRDAFKDHDLTSLILPDIVKMLDVEGENWATEDFDADADPAKPEPWWTPAEQELNTPFAELYGWDKPRKNREDNDHGGDGPGASDTEPSG